MSKKTITVTTPARASATVSEREVCLECGQLFESSLSLTTHQNRCKHYHTIPSSQKKDNQPKHGCLKFHNPQDQPKHGSFQKKKTPTSLLSPSSKTQLYSQDVHPVFRVRKELCSKRRLEREKAVSQLRLYLMTQVKKEQMEEVSNKIKEFIVELLSMSTRWEARHGGLLLLVVYIKWLYQKVRQPNAEYIYQMTKECLQHLQDKEVRLRLAAGKAIGAFCSTQIEGIALYQKSIEDILLTSIEDNMYLERDEQVDDEEGRRIAEKLLAGEAARELAALKQKESTIGNKASPPSIASSQSSIYHDTAGWKSLETDVKCLECIITSSKSAFAPFITDNMMDLICICAIHTNRFVRGLSFGIFKALIGALDQSQLEKLASSENCELVNRLASGLSDSWPQVRMDASIAVRSFLVSISPENRQQHYPMLLPRMCANLYYAAEGVKMYSRHTWRLVIGQEGRSMVTKFIDHCADFYEAQAQLANQEAREAACICMGELATKIDRNCILPRVEGLIDTLLKLLNKGSWTVKLAATQALGQFLQNFSKICQPKLDKMMDLLICLISDRIWSLRQEAACCLVQIVRAFPDYFDKIYQFAKDGLGSAKNQPNEFINKKGESITLSLAELKKLHANDIAQHSNQKMLDCCSIGELPDDDDDHKGHNHVHHWQQTDGCLYIVSELSAFYPKECTVLLPLMAEATKWRQYVNHIKLLEYYGMYFQ